MTFQSYRTNGQNIRSRVARIARASGNKRMTDIIFTAIMAKLDAAIETHNAAIVDFSA
jgi:hypothetical protein